MTDILGPANAANTVSTRKADGRAFPAGDTWFKPCTTPAAQDGTQIQADFLNGLLAQLRAAIRGNGLKNDGVTAIIAENNTNDAMLLGAIQQLIQRGQCNFVPDTGMPDAMVVAPVPALAEYEVGVRLLVLKNPLVAANATTTPTINAGLGAVTIVKTDGSALGIGDLKKGGLFEIELNGANPARLVSLLTISDIIALIAANPTRRNSATLPSTALPNLGAGSWPVPSGVTAVFVQICAPGAGGGGSGSSSQAGGGGGAGGYVEGWVYIAAGVTSLPYVIGAAGVGGNGNTPSNATAGGTTSFAGGALYATGGQPGGTNNGAQGFGGLGYGTNGFSNAYVSNVTGVFTIGGGNGGFGGYLTSDTTTTYGGFGAPSYQNSLIPWTFGGSINGFGPGTGGTGGSRGVGSYLGGNGGAALIRLSW